MFTEIHGFGLGASGLPFVGFIVALIPTLIVYFAYQKYHVIPTFKRDGTIVPETRLTVALVGSLFIPAALFIFGWTSREDISFWGPIVGASLYLPSVYSPDTSIKAIILTCRLQWYLPDLPRQFDLPWIFVPAICRLGIRRQCPVAWNYWSSIPVIRPCSLRQSRHWPRKQSTCWIVHPHDPAPVPPLSVRIQPPSEVKVRKRLDPESLMQCSLPSVSSFVPM